MDRRTLDGQTLAKAEKVGAAYWFIPLAGLLRFVSLRVWNIFIVLLLDSSVLRSVKSRDDVPLPPHLLRRTHPHRIPHRLPPPLHPLPRHHNSLARQLLPWLSQRQSLAVSDHENDYEGDEDSLANAYVLVLHAQVPHDEDAYECGYGRVRFWRQYWASFSLLVERSCDPASS